MARKATVKNTPNASLPARFLTLEEIESAPRKVIGTAHITEFDALCHFREVPATVATGFMEDDISRAEQIRRMAEFVAESLCDENGEDFISYDQTRRFSVEQLESFCVDLAKAYRESRDRRQAERGNGSRR